MSTANCIDCEATESGMLLVNVYFNAKNIECYSFIRYGRRKIVVVLYWCNKGHDCLFSSILMWHLSISVWGNYLTTSTPKQGAQYEHKVNWGESVLICCLHFAGWCSSWLFYCFLQFEV